MFFVQCEVAFHLWEKLYMETGVSCLDQLSARHFGFGKTLVAVC